MYAYAYLHAHLCSGDSLNLAVLSPQPFWPLFPMPKGKGSETSLLFQYFPAIEINKVKTKKEEEHDREYREGEKCEMRFISVKEKDTYYHC